MGASEFTTRAKGKTAQEAFNAAVEEARYECGHGGYTGSIAEKSSFKMVTLPEGKSAGEFIDECMENDSHWSQDKWGPAACINLGESKEKDGTNTYVFFGWASC